MIGFMYEGYFYCANVHKVPAIMEYHVSILSSKLPDGMPARITFKEQSNGLSYNDVKGVSADLVSTIISEIEKHEHIIHP